jgi:hypothetical protein
MARIHGRTIGRTDLAHRAGDHGRVVGIELVTLADGPGRGVRMLEARTGSGLAFRVAVDRGFDLETLDWRGIPLGWHSPVGERNPALHAPEAEAGLGFLRVFTGLLATCGLDHFGGPASEDAGHYAYPYRKRIDHPLHGRVVFTPARLAGYGVDWRGDEGVVWCEGVVLQAAVFGEVLELRRRITAPIGGTEVAIHDVVTNRGFRPTPHQLLYHFNFGWPLLDDGAEVIIPSREIVWMAHEPEAQGVGWRRQRAPRPDFIEQVYQHAVGGEGRMVPAALINEGLAGGLGVLLEYERARLPVLLEWQCLQSGINALGIEPATDNVAGRKAARERGELIVLEHGEERSYETRLSVLEGPAAIDAARRRITALQEPVADMTRPSGTWPTLRR